MLITAGRPVKVCSFNKLMEVFMLPENFSDLRDMGL